MLINLSLVDQILFMTLFCLLTSKQ